MAESKQVTDLCLKFMKAIEITWLTLISVQFLHMASYGLVD